MVGWSVQGEELGQTMEHIVRVQPAVYDDRQTSPGELIDLREHADLPSVMGAILDQVVGPDVVGPAWPETDAGSAVEPEPAPRGLLLGTFSPSRRQMR